MIDVDPSLRQARGSERIAAALREVPFPATKQEVMARLGDLALEVDGASIPLRDLVCGLPLARFASEEQARRAADARWARLHANLAAVERAERRRP